MSSTNQYFDIIYLKYLKVESFLECSNDINQICPSKNKILHNFEYLLQIVCLKIIMIKKNKNFSIKL